MTASSSEVTAPVVEGKSRSSGRLDSRNVNGLHNVKEVKVVQLNVKTWERLRKHFDAYHCSKSDLEDNTVTSFDDIIVKCIDFYEAYFERTS